MREYIAIKTFTKLFKSMKQRIKKRENKIAAYIDKYEKYDYIFFYEAEKSAELVSYMFKGISPEKKAYFLKKSIFVDEDNSKYYGKEILPGKFCMSVKKMYGHQNQAIIIISDANCAEDKEYMFWQDKYQQPDRLLNTTINTEISIMAAANKKLLAILKKQDVFIWQFQKIANQYGKYKMYYDLRDLIIGENLLKFDIKQSLFSEIAENSNLCHKYNKNFFQEFFDKYLKNKNGTFIVCGIFTKNTIQEIDEASKGSYARMYDFEINRVYFEKELQNDIDDKKITVFNTCLGKGNYIMDVKLRGTGDNTYDWFDYASDDFCEVNSLDFLRKSDKVKGKITFIRICLLEAYGLVLTGMKETIKKYKPLFAIDLPKIYVEKQSIAEIFHNIAPDYNFIITDNEKNERILFAYA